VLLAPTSVAPFVERYSASHFLSRSARSRQPVHALLTSAVLMLRQSDPTTFVRRKGSQLTLGGRPFRFAGATNYYMLSRAVDRTTRPQVPGLRICQICCHSPVMYIART